MFLLLLMACLALQVWAWRSLRRRIRSGGLSKLGGLVRYGAWALVPFLALAALFFGVVGLEEITGAAIMPEPYARAALPAAAVLLCLALLGMLSFGIQVAVLERSAHPTSASRA